MTGFETNASNSSYSRRLKYNKCSRTKNKKDNNMLYLLAKFWDLHLSRRAAWRNLLFSSVKYLFIHMPANHKPVCARLSVKLRPRRRDKKTCRKTPDDATVLVRRYFFFFFIQTNTREKRVISDYDEHGVNLCGNDEHNTSSRLGT